MCCRWLAPQASSPIPGAWTAAFTKRSECHGRSPKSCHRTIRGVGGKRRLASLAAGLTLQRAASSRWRLDGLLRRRKCAPTHSGQAQFLHDRLRLTQRAHLRPPRCSAARRHRRHDVPRVGRLGQTSRGSTQRSHQKTTRRVARSKQNPQMSLIDARRRPPNGGLPSAERSEAAPLER